MKIRPFLVVLLLLMGPSTPGLAAQDIHVGVLAYRGAERALSDWDATFAHLSAALPQYRFIPEPGDLTTLTRLVEQSRLDFIITNPGHYVELETSLGMARIATVQNRAVLPAAAIATTLFVPKSSAIEDIKDLKGHKIAAVADDSFGFRVAWAELQKADINPFQDARLLFTGFPADQVVGAVLDGRADAGIVRGCLLESLVREGKIDPQSVRVLNSRPMAADQCQISTDFYPDWPFAKASRTPDDLAKAIARALLTMPAGPGGQSWTVPVDYQAVHSLYRTLKIGPYEALRHPRLADVLWRYRHWLILLGLAGLWWVIHVARVETLVRRRTQELRNAHEATRQRGQEMEHAVRLSLVGEMASSLAHEINQPLAAILNYAHGCQRRLDNGQNPDGIRQGLDQIAVQAERAAAIVRRMRDFVRKRPSAQLDVSLDELARETLSLFEPVARRRGLLLEASLPPNLPHIRADRIQIEEVLLNLLQNAADAVAGQDEKLVALSAWTADGQAHLRVCDNGPGLSKESRARLFETFYTTKPDGLGLGLSLSRGIMEAHGGRLWAETGLDKGTAFHATLPCLPPPDQEPV